MQLQHAMQNKIIRNQLILEMALIIFAKTTKFTKPPYYIPHQITHTQSYIYEVVLQLCYMA